LSVINETLPTSSLAPGNILIRVERFGLSSSNLTKVLAPDVGNSWLYSVDGAGERPQIPVWGYAEVVASNRDGVEPGMGFLGYFPMVRYVTLNPKQQAALGLLDAVSDVNDVSASGLPTLANLESMSDIDLAIILRPLAAAAYLILEELIDAEFWLCEQIIITSASSKTAMSLAYFLQSFFHAHELEHAPLVVGLTAPEHQMFVSSMGFYDQVLSYEHIGGLGASDSVLVDFTGNSSLLARLSVALDELLVHTYGVGASHWDKFSDGNSRQAALKGDAFEPRSYYSELSQERRDRADAGFKAVWPHLCEAFRQWLNPTWVEGADEVCWVYEQMVAGKAKPQSGYLCQL
jgi:hypothetical protein